MDNVRCRASRSGCTQTNAFIRCDAGVFASGVPVGARVGGTCLANTVADWAVSQSSAVAPDDIDARIGNESIDLCEVFRVPEVGSSSDSQSPVAIEAPRLRAAC